MPQRLQIVLVGQLELARRLERPELRQLNQRIGARALLPTLRPAEVREYVEYRLRAHHGDIRKLFKRGALRELARLSGGIPRRINMLCHNALVLAYAQQAGCVSAAHMKEAARDYDHLLAGAATSASPAPHRSARARPALQDGRRSRGWRLPRWVCFIFSRRALSALSIRRRSAARRWRRANIAVTHQAEPAANHMPAVERNPLPAAG